jgi:uncharacterized membrane protein
MHAAESQQISLIGWMFQALGPSYGILLPLVGLIVFLVGLAVVFMNRRTAVIAAYLPFVALPALIGIFGVVHGMIASMSWHLRVHLLSPLKLPLAFRCRSSPHLLE